MAIYDQDTRTVPKPVDRPRLTMPGYTTNNGGAYLPGGDINAEGAGSDPFGYTLGSLLTPWSKPFAPPAALAPAPSAGGGEPAPAGPPPAPTPQFSFPDFSYSFRDPGDFAARDQFKAPADPFTGDRMAAAEGFAGGRFDMGQAFRPDVSPFSMAAYQNPAAFRSTGDYRAERFTAPPGFQAPELTDDPGYQFRLQQGLDAMQNSAAAKGFLRTGATMKDLIDYGQNAASQEYGAAYGRALDTYRTNADMALSAYDRNYAANLGENEIAYNRAAQEFDRSAAMGERAWDRNFGAGMAMNEQAYGRSADEYDRNLQNRLAIDDLNYQRGASEYDRRIQNDRAANEINYNRAASEYDRTFQNAFNVYNTNARNALDAYGATAASNANMGRLGFDVASGTYDRNYEKALTSYQMAEQARLAAMAASYGGGGGGGGGGPSESQLYNRAMQEYMLEMGVFNDNQDRQFNRLVTLSQLGQGSAAALGGYGSNYAANYGNTMMGGANAQAAGIIGGANAWNQGLGAATNVAQNLGALAMLTGGAQQAQSPWYGAGGPL